VGGGVGSGYGLGVEKVGRRRLVAVSVLVALLGVFGLATSAHVGTSDRPGHGAVVLAVATPPAPGIAQPHGAPDLPLADAEPAPPRDGPAPTVRAVDAHEPVPPRAPHQPAAGRAPPA